jgi:hypothetical protein
VIDLQCIPEGEVILGVPAFAGVVCFATDLGVRDLQCGLPLDPGVAWVGEVKGRPVMEEVPELVATGVAGMGGGALHNTRARVHSTSCCWLGRLLHTTPQHMGIFTCANTVSQNSEIRSLQLSDQVA